MQVSADKGACKRKSTDGKATRRHGGSGRSLDKVVPHAVVDLQLHGSPGGVGSGDELKVVTQEHLVATNHLRAQSVARK